MELIHGVDWYGMGTMFLRIFAILLCLVVHEVCHGLAAYWLGDPTAKRSNRLSLNPLHHLDIFGLIMMVTVGFGWAKPVPVNPRYFKRPKLGMAITALAGPLSNLLLALWLLLGVRVMIDGNASMAWIEFLLDTAVLSLGLGVFNLIPIPPLDGSKIVAALLPDKQYNLLLRYERFGMLIIMLLVVFGALGGVMGRAITGIFTLFCRIVGL